MSKKVFEDFIANAALYDEISLTEFAKFFPAEYANTESMVRLYHWYQDDRSKRRTIVLDSITEQLGPIEATSFDDKVEHSLENLQAMEKALQEELEALEAANAERKLVLREFEQQVDRVQANINDVQKTSIPNTADLDKLLGLLQEITAVPNGAQ